ncbi:unnamed protein product [Tetraodon nigroviridis]|nr:unnamed protein product [Tetraodon nigroviridis]
MSRLITGECTKRAALFYFITELLGGKGGSECLK